MLRASMTTRYGNAAPAAKRERVDEFFGCGNLGIVTVGLGDKFDQYPWYLSSGQQQRVAIARALAMESEVPLFDEPTSSLDPELVGEVLQAMLDLSKDGRTMLLVTHELGFADHFATRVVFLHDGLIHEQGTPEASAEKP